MHPNGPSIAPALRAESATLSRSVDRRRDPAPRLPQSAQHRARGGGIRMCVGRMDAGLAPSRSRSVAKGSPPRRGQDALGRRRIRPSPVATMRAIAGWLEDWARQRNHQAFLHRQRQPHHAGVQMSATKCGYQTEQQAGETGSRILFARCMRAHGVKYFPLPEGAPRRVACDGPGRRFNMQSPAVVRGVVACLPPWLRPPGTS
jgi:hypothetical protein